VFPCSSYSPLLLPLLPFFLLMPSFVGLIDINHGFEVGDGTLFSDHWGTCQVEDVTGTHRFHDYHHSTHSTNLSSKSSSNIVISSKRGVFIVAETEEVQTKPSNWRGQTMEGRREEISHIGRAQNKETERRRDKRDTVLFSATKGKENLKMFLKFGR
jgi:hypothetical protein